MKKFINMANFAGYLYQHNLELRTSGPNSKNPGTQFIMGTIDVATDDALLNIVQIHYTYVTEKTAKGTDNSNFKTLMDIINGKIGTVMNNGIDKAAKVRINSAVDVNEFYSDRNGNEELVSAKRNEGGFIHLTNELPEDATQRNKFDVDMLINKVRTVDADPEHDIAEHCVISGYIGDFRGALKPVDFVAYGSDAISYFERLELPCFTRVWGPEVSTTIKKRIEVETAFSGTEIRETTSTRKEFMVTAAQPMLYLWDDESTITEAEIKKAMADREIYLADIKRRNDEYKASKNKPVTTTTVVSGGFNF